jgi:hypothetical protein
MVSTWRLSKAGRVSLASVGLAHDHAVQKEDAKFGCVFGVGCVVIRFG